jgi:hypothetical protein
MTKQARRRNLSWLKGMLSWLRTGSASFHILVAFAAASANAPAAAATLTMVTSCPPPKHTSVNFTIDCSRLDLETKKLCSSFIQNQACRVFAAYRKITGIDVNRVCPTISYTIYNRANWRYGTAGGISFRCRIEMLADGSLQAKAKSAIGPYEVHELLHQFQMASQTLHDITAYHPLFASSMLEAEREIGDISSYGREYARLEPDIQRMRTSLEKGTIRAADTCRIAQSVVEETLYLKDRHNVYKSYRFLKEETSQNPAARLSATLVALSAGASRQFLISHGCQ